MVVYLGTLFLQPSDVSGLETEVRAQPEGHRSCGKWPSVTTIKVNDILKTEVTKGLV